MKATGRLPTALLVFAHGSVDIYQGMVPVLVPFLVSDRHYSYVQVAGFVLAATLLSSIVQPAFGLLTDRFALPALVPLAMIAAGAGVALVGVHDSYVVALGAVALSGLGVAAFHPEAARLARSVTGGSHVGMSWFSLGGNVGFALAPLVAAPILATGGLAATPWLVLPALLGTAVVVPLLRKGQRAGKRPPTASGVDDWPRFRTLSAIIVLRSVLYVGLSTFVSLYAQQRIGPSHTVSAVALFLLFAGGAVGTVLGGRLATRFGRVRTMRVAYAVSVAAVVGIVLVPGAALLAFIALAAVALYVPFSLHITLGQDYLPNRIGTASGVTLGLAVSVGGVFAPVLGLLAEASSLRWMLAALVVLPIAASLLTYRLREPAPLETTGAQ